MKSSVNCAVVPQLTVQLSLWFHTMYMQVQNGRFFWATANKPVNFPPCGLLVVNFNFLNFLCENVRLVYFAKFRWKETAFFAFCVKKFYLGNNHKWWQEGDLFYCFSFTLIFHNRVRLHFLLLSFALFSIPAYKKWSFERVVICTSSAGIP